MLAVVPLLCFLAALGPSLSNASPGVYPPAPANKCKAANSGLSSYEAFKNYAELSYNQRDIAGSIRTYFNPDFIWHAPDHAASGLRGLDGAIQDLENVGFATGDVGFNYIVPPCGKGPPIGTLYYRFHSKGYPTIVSSDAYRFEGPCVAEYWGLYFQIEGNSTESDFFDKKLADKAVVPKCVDRS